MKTDSKKRFQITLTLTWLFTVIYSFGYFMNMQLFSFTKWIDRIYAPIFTFFFGGSS